MRIPNSCRPRKGSAATLNTDTSDPTVRKQLMRELLITSNQWD